MKLMLQLLAIRFSGTELLFEEREPLRFALVGFGAFFCRLLAKRLDFGQRFVEPSILLLNELGKLRGLGSLVCELARSLGQLMPRDSQIIAFSDQLVAEPFDIAVELLDEVVEGRTFLAKQGRGFCNQAQGGGRRLIGRR
jgi:hypothetical protein